MAWTDEKKQEVIDKYVSAEPTAENSMDIVQELAEEYEESPNGVRMILSKAGVYVKKETSSAAKPAAKKEGSTSTRISKDGAQQELISLLEERGADIDPDVISKLTGKAAQYFTNVIKGL